MNIYYNDLGAPAGLGVNEVMFSVVLFCFVFVSSNCLTKSDESAD